MKTSLPDIGIYGTGNLAWKLGEALHDASYPISSVWGRNRSDRQALARRLHAQALENQNEGTAAIKILVVSDSAIAALAQSMATNEQSLVIHCAGAGDFAWLHPHPRTGIFWPLQAIRKELEVSWQEIPVLVDANNPQDLAVMLEMGNRLSKKAQAANAQERTLYHAAAVMSANFGNLLLDQAYNLLHEQGLDHRLLIPILENQLKQFATEQRPMLRQTGPASRGDQPTMQKHLQLLAEKPTASAMYRLLSELINQEQKKL